MNAVVNLRSNKQRINRVLAVDDDRTTLFLLATQLEDMGYDVITAGNGREALNILNKDSDVDVILLDREMPEMGGMEMVALLKQDARLSNIPVIMQTGSGKPEQIKEGIDIGVYYYLTKPLQREVLKSVILAAIRDSDQRRVLASDLEKHKKSFGMIESCTLSYSTLAEAEQLSVFIANFYPKPEKILMGLAELLINAVEHGNLQVHYEEKTKLIANGAWRDEVQRREKLEENQNKKIHVIFVRKTDGLYLRITDSGKGFDWKSYMQIDPSRASDNHGRGIAVANMVSFDKISYNDAGNEVTAFVGFEPELQW